MVLLSLIAEVVSIRERCAEKAGYNIYSKDIYTYIYTIDTTCDLIRLVKVGAASPKGKVSFDASRSSMNLNILSKSMLSLMQRRRSM